MYTNSKMILNLHALKQYVFYAISLNAEYKYRWCALFCYIQKIGQNINLKTGQIITIFSQRRVNYSCHQIIHWIRQWADFMGKTNSDLNKNIFSFHSLLSVHKDSLSSHCAFLYECYPLAVARSHLYDDTLKGNYVEDFQFWDFYSTF